MLGYVDLPASIVNTCITWWTHHCVIAATTITVIPCLHDEANIKQFEHTSCTCIL